MHQLRASATLAPAYSVFNHKLTTQASVKDSDNRSIFPLSLKRLKLMLLSVPHPSGAQLLFSSPVATRHHLEVNPLKSSASRPIVAEVVPPLPSPLAHPLIAIPAPPRLPSLPVRQPPLLCAQSPSFSSCLSSVLSHQHLRLPLPSPPMLQPSGPHGTSAAFCLRQRRVLGGRTQA